MRASSIFPILSVGLLFFGGLCVAASEFYKSKHNVILSAGIFFVSAGRSCPAGRERGLSRCAAGAHVGTWGGTRGAGGRLGVLPGTGGLSLVSCPIPGEKSSGTVRKTHSSHWPRGRLARKSFKPHRVSLGDPSMGQVLGGSALSHHGAPGPGQQVEGLPQSYRKNNSALRGRSFRIAHFSVHCSPTLPLIIL